MNRIAQAARPAAEATPRPVPAPARRMIGAVLLVHSIAHLAGTTQAVTAIDDGSSVAVLGGLVDLDGAATLAAWAVVWAALAAAVAGAAVWTLLDRAGARGVVTIVTSVSLAACIVGLWPTVIGVAVNIGVLVAVRLIGGVR